MKTSETARNPLRNRPPEPLIIPRAKHPISRKNIDDKAIKILYRLKNSGFTAYLAGGAVRDMLLGQRPADFDIVTDANPKQIKKLFRNSRIIGRRFRLVHIFFYDRNRATPQIFETATFRRAVTLEEDDLARIQEEPELANNLFGTPDEDALRRDFTINALFYNIADFSVIDHVSGLKDLEDGIVRIIGDPDQRFTEDPVRVLRALEFACRLNFTIENETAKGLMLGAPALAGVSASRLREELRGLYSKKVTAGLLALGQQYQINQHWLPDLIAGHIPAVIPLIQQIEHFFPLAEDDNELEKMIFTAMLLPGILRQCPLADGDRLNLIQEKIDENLKPLNERFSLPRFQRHAIKEIFTLLYRLGRGDKRINQLLKRDNFFAALFFYAVSTAATTPPPSHFSFWAQQGERLNRSSKARGLDYGSLFNINRTT
ncbi:MAG: CCA tRNA nucleotidyltransferase [Deltaproteobacteria bacterium]|nr:CCA tRNA nucleotidyltransferase [Deltaproteobacteria bacterium]